MEKAGVELLDCVHKTPPAVNTGLPYVAIPQVRNGEIDLTSARRITPEAFSDWTKKTRPQAFDVVLSRRCNPGETAVVRPGMEFALGQNLVLLRSTGSLVKPEFLRWLARSHYWWRQVEKFLNVGAVFDSLRCADVPKFEVPIPPLHVQEAIETLLGALDDKIELNRRMNETLDGMGRALFQDWFVDFGPTYAKIEGRAPYLEPDLWTLFPDGFDAEGRPEGWKEGTLAEVAELNTETWKRSTYPDVIRYVDLSNTKWGTVQSTEEHSKESAPSRAQRVLRIGDTIVGTVRPGNGSYAFIGDQGLTGSTGFAVLRPRASEYREFVYLAATSRDNIERLAHLADGGAYPAVRPEIVLETSIAGFDAPVLRAFSSVLEPLFGRMEANKRESHTLAETRDLLLPKLMSGEIRLRDAEKVVESVA